MNNEEKEQMKNLYNETVELLQKNPQELDKKGRSRLGALLATLKNPFKRVQSPKMSTIIKVFLAAAVTASMFTSCQSLTINPDVYVDKTHKVYTLEHGDGALTAAQEIGQRTMFNEYVKAGIDVGEVFGQSGYIRADNKVELNRQQSLVKMDIQDRKITFVTDIDIYKQHKEDVDWVYQYVATVMNVVSPGISVAKAFSEDALTDSRERTGSSIFVGLKDGLNGMAEHEKRLNYAASLKKGDAVYDETIAFNADWEKLNNSTYFRTALLREVMSSLGLQDIKKSLGGNIMSDIDQLKDYPLALSPAEMTDLFVMYGDISRANYNDQYIDWYTQQYKDANALDTINPAGFHYDRNAGLEM